MKAVLEDPSFGSPGMFSASHTFYRHFSETGRKHGHSPSHERREVVENLEFERIVDDICDFPWDRINPEEILKVALAYYYFSIQFRENLEIACRLFPNDQSLKLLHKEECNTSNLSPWESVAEEDEAMNHDEFMRRLLLLQPVANEGDLKLAGARYLARTRDVDELARAKSIASYEDGGLARVFSAMLRARTWTGAGSLAFKHFLEKHIEFDSPVERGHGALSRHITIDDSILPLWLAFKDILQKAVPAFAGADVQGE